MARHIKNSKIDTRNARDAVPIGAAIIYADLGVDGADLGYRKGKTGGKWVLRRYVGDKKYAVETLAAADDRADADGVNVLSYRQAQAAARARHEKLTRQEQGLPSSGPYTVTDAMTDYLSHKEAEGAKSVKDSRVRSEAFIIPQLGSTEISKITPKQIRDWLTKVAKTPARVRTRKPGPSGSEKVKQQHKVLDLNDPEMVRKRRATANRTLTILKAALNHAWREGHTPSDDAWRRVQPFKEADAARQRYLSVAEARLLIDAAEGAFRSLVQAALQTGARYSELGNLRVSEFNPDAGTVFVRASKSGKARHIVLTEEGRSLFADLCAGKPSNAFILTRDDGSRWEKSFHIRSMREAVERANLGKDVTFHILRHTWASLAVMNGVPLLVVADNLGHADTRMVEKHYGHLAQSYKADAIRANAPRFGISEYVNK